MLSVPRWNMKYQSIFTSPMYPTALVTSSMTFFVRSLNRSLRSTPHLENFLACPFARKSICVIAATVQAAPFNTVRNAFASRNVLLLWTDVILQVHVSNSIKSKQIGSAYITIELIILDRSTSQLFFSLPRFGKIKLSDLIIRAVLSLTFLNVDLVAKRH